MAYAQSGANSLPDPGFGLRGPQTAVPGVASFGAVHSCDALRANQSQTGSPADLNHIFHVPCLDLRSNPIMVARNESPLKPPQQRIWPNAKSEPIPTQWPNAHIEQIPTQWPNLKMEPLTAQAKAKP
jgi:hypothetical protein